MDITNSISTQSVMKSTELMRSIRLTYDLEINSIFEKRLMQLAKNNKKISLSMIQLNVLNIEGDESPLSIPIGRVKVTQEGKICCESMITQLQLNSCNEVYLEGIKVVAENKHIAATIITDGNKPDIDFEKLQSPVVILSVNFKTDYPQVIEKILPNDPMQAFIYALYDEIVISDNSEEVSFYTEINFVGDRYVYKIGECFDFTGANNSLNDKFKSVKVGSKCKLHVYEDGYYKGKKTIFTENSANMNIGNGGLSSFVITTHNLE
jgi:hypothetical protein